MSEVINYFSGLSQDNGWIEFIAIIGFIAISLILLSRFMGRDPRKWVTFLAAFLGSGSSPAQPLPVSAIIPDSDAEKEKDDDEIVINGFVMKGDK